MFNNYAQVFIFQNKPNIKYLFYALNCNIIQYDCCRIYISLEKIFKFKYNQFNIFNFNNNVTTIYDCFDYNKKINIMLDDNSMYCNYCKRICNSLILILLNYIQLNNTIYYHKLIGLINC